MLSDAGWSALKNSFNRDRRAGPLLLPISLSLLYRIQVGALVLSPAMPDSCTHGYSTTMGTSSSFSLGPPQAARRADSSLHFSPFDAFFPSGILSFSSVKTVGDSLKSYPPAPLRPDSLDFLNEVASPPFLLLAPPPVPELPAAGRGTRSTPLPRF